MQIKSADVWKLFAAGYVVVIPTNLTTNKDGAAVMGRGIALQAVRKIGAIDVKYGKFLQTKPDRGGIFFSKKKRLFLLPVKDHFSEKASLKMIGHGLFKLNGIATKNSDLRFALPMLGCGFGSLTYEMVLPLMLRKIKAKNIILVIPPSKIYENKKYRESFLPGVCGRKDRRVTMVADDGKFPDIYK